MWGKDLKLPSSNTGGSSPIPQSILQELLAQLEMVKQFHENDLKAGYAGAFLDDSLEKKYRNASKDFIWQPRDSASPGFNRNGMRRSPREVAYDFRAAGSC